MLLTYTHLVHFNILPHPTSYCSKILDYHQLIHNILKFTVNPKDIWPTLHQYSQKFVSASIGHRHQLPPILVEADPMFPLKLDIVIHGCFNWPSSLHPPSPQVYSKHTFVERYKCQVPTMQPLFLLQLARIFSLKVLKQVLFPTFL